MISEIDRAFMDAIYPQIRDTKDSRLRAEALKRSRRARAALAAAGYKIVPCAPTAKGDSDAQP
jgi:hypothetical protein